SSYLFPYRRRSAPLSFPTRRSSDLTVLRCVCVPYRRFTWIISPIIMDFALTLKRANANKRKFLVCKRKNLCQDIFCLQTRNFRRSEEHTSELQSRFDLVCRLLLEKK